MINSNNESIADILKSIDEGKTQLPDFQRGWVWEDGRIRALIASISNGYPIGAAMFCKRVETIFASDIDFLKEWISPRRMSNQKDLFSMGNNAIRPSTVLCIVRRP